MSLFIKPPLDINEQIRHLQDKGLIIADSLHAESVLRRIGLYRFKGFGLIYQERNPPKLYVAGTDFSSIEKIIDLDEKLRLHILKGIQCIEINIRLNINEYMMLKYTDSRWYTNKKLFSKNFNHTNLFTKTYMEFMKSKELFTENYKIKYGTREHPPSWMLIEIMSFGNWSILYEGLDENSDKQDIADIYHVQWQTFQEWLKNLVVLRNVCAHHSRVWNRIFKTMPFADKYPKSIKTGIKSKIFSSSDPQSLKLAPRLFILNKIIRIIDKNNTWFDELIILLENYNQVEIDILGLRKDWEKQPEWL